MTRLTEKENGTLPLTRVEISLGALTHNIRELRRITASSAQIMAVVKADGYGHGAEKVAAVALKNGASFLAVARMNEAAALRDAGVDAPIMLFGSCLDSELSYAAANDLRLSLNSFHQAKTVSEEAVRIHATIKAHLKIDTGMGRLGMVADGLGAGDVGHDRHARVIDDILAIDRLPGIEIEGVFTHFANADVREPSHAREQFQTFLEILEMLETRHGFQAPLRHAANSAALIQLPETHLDMVRPGISLYGLRPSDETDMSGIDLVPAMTLVTTVIQVKEVGAGFAVSYGSTFRTSGPTTIATVPIGYADGFSRRLSSVGAMLVNGQRAPILGRVCMDLTLLDVGRISGVKPGSEVVVWGRQEEAEISADEVAKQLDTINYEVVSSLTARVPKVYRP